LMAIIKRLMRRKMDLMLRMGFLMCKDEVKACNSSV
jgi:hypothetical protein